MLNEGVSNYYYPGHYAFFPNKHVSFADVGGKPMRTYEDGAAAYTLLSAAKAEQNSKEKPMENSLKITVNGVTLEGPSELVITNAKKLGYDVGGLYYSESKKTYVEIKNMPFEYLRNAFLKLLEKRLTKFYADAHQFTDAKSLCKYMGAMPNLVDKDVILSALLTELLSR